MIKAALQAEGKIMPGENTDLCKAMLNTGMITTWINIQDLFLIIQTFLKDN